MSLPFNIAIDGYSSCGKSTIAKHIACKYAMQYIDTGAMYRAITYFCIKKEIISNKIINIDKLDKYLNDINIKFEFNIKTKEANTYLDNQNVEKIIRGFQVSENVSHVAKVKIIRNKLIKMQKSIGKNGNVVMDGRDIGSKVFPDAKIKFFITANSEVRAKRRLLEKNISFLHEKDEKCMLQSLIKQMNDRDKLDSSRSISPLVPAKDAYIIDTSLIDANELFEMVTKIIDGV